MSRKLHILVWATLVLMAVWFAVQSSDAARFRRANNRLVALGLRPYEENGDITLQGKVVSDFSFLKEFPSVQYLNLSSTSVTDDDMRYIGKIPLLQAIDLRDTSVGDASMRYLVRHRETLGELHLADTLITGETLPLFLKLHQLNLDGCPLSPRGIKRIVRIAEANGIGSLSIRRTPISDENLEDLMAMQCDTLVVSSGQLSKDSVRRLTAVYDVEVQPR